MRILGFSKKWDKLCLAEFTTFRHTRRDRDWEVGEKVQVVFKPRTKGRQVLGIAKIIKKEPRTISSVVYITLAPQVSESEAIADGFKSKGDMITWVDKIHGVKRKLEPMNKLTLIWIGKI